jgi:hypothetical protein
MSVYHTTHDPHWETHENGWHAVVALCNKGYQWTAYIEFADAPSWRIWAGCMFPTIQEAQEWCKNEIAHQKMLLRASRPVQAGDSAVVPSAPSALNWLWQKLRLELGDHHAEEIRDELSRRLHEDSHVQQIGNVSVA